jgi:plastocyanin
MHRMTGNPWPLKRAVLLLGFAMAAVGLAGAAAAGGAPPPATRFFSMAAVEPKGGATVDKEPFPAEPLPTGKGYLLKTPDAKTGRWEVSTYRWDPAQIVVIEGDTVVLEILGVNGDIHPSTIERYVPAFEVRRGRITRLTFTADRAGFFRIECTTHQPSMVGYLVVLPRR